MAMSGETKAPLFTFKQVAIMWLVLLTVCAASLLISVVVIMRVDDRHYEKENANTRDISDEFSAEKARIQALEKKVAALEAREKLAAPSKP